MEDGSFAEPSVPTVSFRLALSDPSLGTLINDNFIFFAARYNHKPMKRLVDSISTKPTFPYFAVISPIFVVNNDGNFQKVKGTSSSLRELRRYSSLLQDIKASKITKFLQK